MRASSLVLVSLFAAACGQPQSYKLVDVPHCQVPEGQARSGFAERVRWLYNAGDSAGEGPVAGEWPSLGIGADDSVTSGEMVLAVVSCPNGNPKEGANRGKELTASKVPEVCPGQQTLYHGTLKATDDATAKERGFAGVLKFPAVALTCPVGTLARTTSADIKPLAK
jgi:hypothetical protein